MKGLEKKNVNLKLGGQHSNFTNHILYKQSLYGLLKVNYIYYHSQHKLNLSSFTFILILILM